MSAFFLCKHISLNGSLNNTVLLPFSPSCILTSTSVSLSTFRAADFPTNANCQDLSMRLELNNIIFRLWFRIMSKVLSQADDYTDTAHKNAGAAVVVEHKCNVKDVESTWPAVLSCLLCGQNDLYAVFLRGSFSTNLHEHSCPQSQHELCAGSLSGCRSWSGRFASAASARAPKDNATTAITPAAH